MSSAEDPRLSKLSDICLGFPETTRMDSGRHASFLVRKKTFAWFLDDHHGDGIVSISCKMGLGENEEIVRADPKRFYLPAYMEAESRSWMARCACGFARSIWELGGIRWKATGQPRQYLSCPQCGQRSWHTVTRDPKT